MKRPLRESDIEKYLVKRVKALGGMCNKLEWIGRAGAPDRVVMLPATFWPDTSDWKRRPQTIWVEVKAPGKVAEPHQAREHTRMRKLGQRVEVVDSFARVDEVLS